MPKRGVGQVKTRVRLTALVVSPSEQGRRGLRQTLEADGIEVIGVLRSPLFALPMLELRWPEVLVLDRPGTEGVVFLQRVTEVRPTPVIITSTVTDADVDDLQCLAGGTAVLVPRDGMGHAPMLARVARSLTATPALPGPLADPLLLPS